MEMEDLPTDYARGVDFRVTKTQKGGYADYSTSSWARRERPLSEFEMSAINNNGLHKLADFLPKRPSDVELKVMKEMFEASVNGEPFDNARWGQYFRPAGFAQRTGDPQKAASPQATAVSQSAPVETAPAAAPEATPAPAAEAAPAEGGNAQDILAMIRSRQG